MSAARTPRVAIALTTGERDALRRLAARAREPEARTAARLLRQALAEHHHAPLDAPPQQRTGPRPPVSAGTAWLPPGKRLFDIEALRARYPHHFEHLPPDPLAEPAVSEPLAALSVWREALDDGGDHDPRSELAFTEALDNIACRLERLASPSEAKGSACGRM